jgi:NAD(P)-dependent dehydrogenase (short-subunit alcohol dehydrogenase family)
VVCATTRRGHRPSGPREDVDPCEYTSRAATQIETAAPAFASRGLPVNAVSLGVIKTPAHDPVSYAELGVLHPLDRVGEVADVVEGVLYLEQATFVTGEALHIDGGQAARTLTRQCTPH